MSPANSKALGKPPTGFADCCHTGRHIRGPFPKGAEGAMEAFRGGGREVYSPEQILHKSDGVYLVLHEYVPWFHGQPYDAVCVACGHCASSGPANAKTKLCDCCMTDWWATPKTMPRPARKGASTTLVSSRKDQWTAIFDAWVAWRKLMEA